MTSVAKLQESVGQRLADELPKFTGRTGWDVVTEVKGDVENMVRKALLKLGVGLCVFTPTWARGDFEDRRDATVVVSVVETQIINMGETGMRVPGIDLCWVVDGVLNGFTPGGGWTPLLFEGCAFVDSPFAGSNSWDLTFKTSAIVAVAEENYDETPVEEEPLAK